MLYDPSEIKENCGFGLIAHIEGKASHKIVRSSIHALTRMQHRGAILSDGKTGDGCGLLLQKPDRFYQIIAEKAGWRLAKNYAVGMVFLNQNEEKAAISRRIVEEEIKKETLHVLGWREVPININTLGDIARASLPRIEQIFINAPAGWQAPDLQRRLFMARRRIEKRMDDTCFYICSLSNLIVVYKALCMPADLAHFYLDLADLRLESAICLFHQRFSTNTLPHWPLAQPFRYLAHNGEINTITGNRQWARARAYKFKTPLIPDLSDAAPFVNEKGSDSSALDNMLELLLCGGMDLVRAMRLLIPPAWQHRPNMDTELKAFFDFNSMHMEPWDGPAGIVMTDGRLVACGLDRNGLRPARYVITKDQLITCGSEIGIWDYAADEVIEKGRIGAGELLVIDTKKGKILYSWQTDNDLKNRHPYQQWMMKNVIRLTPVDLIDDEQIDQRHLTDQQLAIYQKLFVYSHEEIEQVLYPLAQQAQEVTSSMGDDTPIAVLSQQPRLIYDYFRQQFAQVTNPPIDPLRENHVMSLATNFGREMNLFCEAEGQAHRLSTTSPILVYSDFQQLMQQESQYYRPVTLSLQYQTASHNLEQAIIALCDEAEQHVRNGAVLLVLSDRNIDPLSLPIPAILAVGALHNRLVNQNLRCDANLIIETASARDPHHFAVLLSFGATAIYPYLAYEILLQQIEQGKLTLPKRQAIYNFRAGINKGLYKIMSKMGISTIASYRCARLFEILGLHPTIIQRCFPGAISRIGGADFDDLQTDLLTFAQQAWDPSFPLAMGGLLKFVYGGEYHAYHPDVVQTLQKAVTLNDNDAYQHYRQLINQRPIATLRDLFALRSDQTPIPLTEVESAQQLFKRFDSAAMSIGALSPEAHEALAIAMNTLGGYSNSGEGGEDSQRYATPKVSRIKQIASGRFGVTPHYLVNAEVIQIKITQGAKPGEGGQLPGSKVTPYIAKLRYSIPGVTLISPPPHHDIYSIEDLSQLIFDLKQMNPKALISVKLVSEAGVGTIACGVAKAYADLITLSGYDGGTGASPLSSVKYAGAPWELGLVETQQALVANGLRHQVRLQVDGGLKSGLDIVKAAILGAESFGFGTGPMIALGCKYLRLCHLNNCAMGIATQYEPLRQQHFKGRAQNVINYFHFIAEETRQIMANLGIQYFVDLIGRTDLLTLLPGCTSKQRKLTLAPLLALATPMEGKACYCTDRNPPIDTGQLNQTVLKRVLPYLELPHPTLPHFTICNTDRSVGAALSGYLATHYDQAGIAHAPIDLHFVGTAGQSFAVWNMPGVTFHLIGDANDYVGKGMAGGMIIIQPPHGSSFKSDETVIIGNTCLYGATGGQLFAAGQAGERFAVRNSGAIAVVEGIGDNGCEYMTGGIVCILGKIGINFAAGMTGGFAFVLDESAQFEYRVNSEQLTLQLLLTYPTQVHHLLYQLIRQHYQMTSSVLAEVIINDWPIWLTKFRVIHPKAADINHLFRHYDAVSIDLNLSYSA